MKQHLLLIFLLLQCSSLWAQHHKVEVPKIKKWDLSEGLIAHYPFNGNANDTTNYGHHGTVNGAEFRPDRCGDWAAYFDGKQNYIDCGTSKILQKSLSRGFSLSFWAYPNMRGQEDPFGLMLGRWAFDPLKDHFSVFLNSENRVTVAVGDGNNHTAGVYSATKLQDKEWYHIGITWQVNGTIQIFINGRLDKTGQQEGRGLNMNSEISLKFGRQIIKFNRAYKGLLDEVRIYNRTLRQEEIHAIYVLEGGKCNHFYLEGLVLNQKTNKPLGVGATVYLEDLETGSSIIELKADPKTGYFGSELPLGFYYGISAKADNHKFLSINQSVDTRLVTSDSMVRKKLLMVPFDTGEVVLLNNLFFDSNKADLRSESLPELDKLLVLFNEFPNMKAEIGGHTDSVGSDTHNQTLSQKRAESVRQYLLEKGVSSDRITAKGYGESHPVADNATEDGRQMNRRVEMKIIEI